MQAQNLVFNESQFPELAETIAAYYFKTMGLRHVAPANTNLKRMFITLFTIKQKNLKNAKQKNEVLIKKLSSKAYSNQFQHLDHQNQEQVDRLLQYKEDQKLFKRLIDFKNQKILQLNHLSQKYDKLLQIVKKYRQNQTKLIRQVTGLQDTNRQLLQKLTLKQKQIQQLKLLKAKLNIKMGEVIEKQKSYHQSFDSLKIMIAQQFEQIQNIYVKSTSEIKNKFEQLLNRFKTVFTAEFESLSDLIAKKQEQNRRCKNTIKQLIYDLSQASKFQKQQGESDEQWLQRYRNFKQARTKNITNQVSVQRRFYQDQVYSKQKLTDNSQFIQKSKRFISKYQKPAAVKQNYYPQVLEQNLKQRQQEQQQQN